MNTTPSKRTSKTQSDSAKDEAYLLAAGWTVVDKMWRDPRHKGRPGYGDYGTSGSAVKRQREYERFDTGLPIYAVCAARDGFGYLLRRGDGEDKAWTTVYRYHDEDQLIEAATKWNGCLDPKQIAAEERALKSGQDDYAYPYILVFKEKYGDRYFAAPTLAAYHAVCLKVLKERAEDGDSWGYWENESGDVEPPSLTKEQAAALPEGRVKKFALQEWEDYERTIKQNASAKASNDLLNRALKNGGDGELAAAFLQSRKDGEYEGLELIELETVP